MMAVRPRTVIGWVVALVVLAAFWAAAIAIQQDASEPTIPAAERLLIAGQVFAVAVAWRWPVAGALMAGASIALTGIVGYQGSLAVGLLPVVVLVASVRGDARAGGVAALLVGGGWLWFIFAVPGPAPAVPEYFGVTLGAVTPFLGVQLIRAVRQRRHA